MQLQQFQECRQVQLHECRVCRQGINQATQGRTALDLAMFGAKALAVCPSCGQEADKSDHNYRRRATRWLRKRPSPAVSPIPMDNGLVICRFVPANKSPYGIP